MPEIGAFSRFKLEIQGLGSAVAVARFDGVEAVSEPFQFELVLMSNDTYIAFADVVGKPALLTIEADQGEPRYVQGIVSRFRQAEEGKRTAVYQATLVPKVWRLMHRRDSRIFQELAVPDIIEKVLASAGLVGGDYRLSLTGAHPVREYCVQYRESDFAFISRLMEEEGIYYFFEHHEDKHVLVMGDAPSASGPIASPDTIPFRPSLGAMVHGESVSRFAHTEEVRPGKVTLSDYNFKKPSLSLTTSAQASGDTDLEMYDYPGEYDIPGDGTALAKVRLEAWQSLRVVGDGESGCTRMTAGHLFTLSDHPRDDNNRGYLLTRVHHRGAQAQMGEDGSLEGASYANTFQCIPSDVPYRPERRTPRPTLRGVQTAIVTGAGGAEVHTDEHGRVKVQFHWDREGKRDDKSSCWIRVSQLWAGAGWGAMWIPRVGHEVVVDFIEGDPDRPIIVGRVYHGANVPPYPLPGEKTKSTIKSDSSPGGGGSNELRFEDKKGSEEIYLHGQKDWNIVIKNDKNQKIGHDETLSVANDQTINVDHNRMKAVANDQVETVGGNKSIDVKGHHSESIHGNETVTVDGNESLTVSGNRNTTVSLTHNETILIAQTSTIGGAWSKTVGAAMALQVAGTKTETVGLASTETVGGNKSTSVKGGASLDVGKDLGVSVAKKAKVNVAEDAAVDIKKTLTIVVGETVELKCGEAKVTIDKKGNIRLEGKDISVLGSGPLKVEGKKIEVESKGTVELKASGKVIVNGSAVNLN
jgi:type VI secretion system secreted protein VgrG